MKRTFLKSMVLAALAASIAACANRPSQIEMSGQPTQGQKMVYSRGVPVIVEKDQQLAVLISPLRNPRLNPYEASFFVAVSNRSERPFDIGIANVSVNYGKKLAKVYSYEDLAGEAYQVRANRRLAAALAYSSQSLNASYAGQTTYSGYSTSDFNSGGVRGHGSSTYYGSSYDPAKVQEVQNQAGKQLRQSVQSSNREYSASLAALGNYLRRTTIMPGATTTGFFTVRINNFQYGRQNQVDVRLLVEGKPLNFHFVDSVVGYSGSGSKADTPAGSSGVSIGGRKIWGGYGQGGILKGRTIWGSSSESSQ